MQQDFSPQGIRGSLLPVVLQETCCRLAQCIQGMTTAWSCHIGRSSLAGSYPEHSELPCTLGIKCGAIVSCNVLIVHLQLVQSGCAAEWLSA